VEGRRKRQQSLFLIPFSFFLFACASSPSTPDIHLNTQLNTIDVTGLSGATLKALSGATLTAEEWQGVLRVSVDPAAPAVAGKYAVIDSVLRFTPLFPLD
jgi:hypothetical protein